MQRFRSNISTSLPAIAVAVLLFCCHYAPAQQATENCPWLNAATAGGVIGSQVRMSVTHPPNDRADQPNGAPGDATCEFTPQDGAANTSIRIAVHTMQDHAKDYAAFVSRCGPSPRKLIGVGNEAVACTLEVSAGTVTEQVVARVRDRVFIFSWSMPQADANSSKETAQAIQGKLQNTAEQIAGSLF
jgi:hypothetical protein